MRRGWWGSDKPLQRGVGVEDHRHARELFSVLYILLVLNIVLRYSIASRVIFSIKSGYGQTTFVFAVRGSLIAVLAALNVAWQNQLQFLRASRSSALQMNSTSVHGAESTISSHHKRGI